MVAQQPTALRITAHATPHASDPANASELYAALGMFMVAWGRFEGHFNGALLQILALPEAADIAEALSISWDRRAKFWRKAFTTLPSLQPMQGSAEAFIERVMLELPSRHVVSHAIWDEFSAEAAEPTILARTVAPQRGQPNGILVTDYRISLSMIRADLAAANLLNQHLTPFTLFLGSLRRPPAEIRVL
jgi:hypothetical protein